MSLGTFTSSDASAGFPCKGTYFHVSPVKSSERIFSNTVPGPQAQITRKTIF